MKKIIFLCAGLIMGFSAISQHENKSTMADWNPDVYRVGKKYPGYIVKLDGDTIRGYIKADTRCAINGIGKSNQNSCAFYLAESDKKPVKKYKPTEIKGYKIADKVYESIKYSGGLLKKPNFNLVVTEGAIRIYEWYSTVDNFSTLIRQTGETWQQFDERLYEIKLVVGKSEMDPIEFGFLGLSFVKKMPAYISDHQEMVQKVENKEKGYKFFDIFEVIDEYNKWHRMQR